MENPPKFLRKETETTEHSQGIYPDPTARSDEKEILYPFAAIVNQEAAKEALILSLINPATHGVLLLGEKGTGKTTLVRSVSTLLPEIQVVDLPLGSGEEMVLGTVDVEKALAMGKVTIKPGVLTRADGHILYIDEVNLLPDHLMDVILDAAATGRYTLEREGISALCHARFILVGSMNPEEGWLRPQLLDRFGLAVHVRAIASPEGRAEVYRRAQAFETSPEEFRQHYQHAQREVSEKLRQARKRLEAVQVPDKLVRKTIETILALGVSTHRAELTILRAAQARAAWEKRDAVEWEDVKEVMPMALQHRMPGMEMQKTLTWEFVEDRALRGKNGSGKKDKNGWFPTPFYRKKKALTPRKN
jgi:Mg-chelatase subunit ChlI